MSTICNFDHTTLDDFDYGPHSPYDTLPLPDEVEREFLDHAGDDVTAWFEQHDIAAAPIGKLIQYAMVWNPETGRYRFLIYGPDHIGPKHAPELAVPIFEDGNFVDLLFISDEMTFVRATCRAPWLGRVTGPVVRLHAHPMDWIESGCAGVCHIEPISRKALKDLQAATTIECSDIHTALNAWSWGFDSDDDELARFDIDDTPASISRYIEDEVEWRVLSRLRREGLPIGADPAYVDPNFSAQVEKMRSEYVYAKESRS
jgi:hypothetical protein